MMSFEESISILESLDVKTRGEKLFLSDTLGRVLYGDIIAHESYPSSPMSAMDGYAIRFDDIDRYEKLKISAINPAGSDERFAISEGEAIKTFTGSLMPEGADTLVPIEFVSVKDGYIVINESISRGYAVRDIGESYMAGERLIAGGSAIGYAEIGVMAGLNRVMVDVAQKPRVSIIATGSELLDIGEPSSHSGEIRSSNSYTLQALATTYGAEALQMGIVGDSKEMILHRFQSAIESSDIVVSSGGVSVGDFDFVKDIIPELGFEVIFKGVNIKPGQHIMLAQKDDKFIVALPGFAYSSTVTFILYVVPLISKMLGRKKSYEIIDATLKAPFKKPTKKREFHACNLTFSDGRYYVDFDGKKSGTSAILTNMLGDCALMMGEDKNAGEGVRVIKL